MRFAGSFVSIQGRGQDASPVGHPARPRTTGWGRADSGSPGSHQAQFCAIDHPGALRLSGTIKDQKLPPCLVQPEARHSCPVWPAVAAGRLFRMPSAETAAPGRWWSFIPPDQDASFAGACRCRSPAGASTVRFPVLGLNPGVSIALIAAFARWPLRYRSGAVAEAGSKCPGQTQAREGWSQSR